MKKTLLFYLNILHESCLLTKEFELWGGGGEGGVESLTVSEFQFQRLDLSKYQLQIL